MNNIIFAKDKDISPLSNQFIPDGLREDSLKLNELMKAYYEWSEQTGNFQKESKKLMESFTFDTADDSYLTVFKDTLIRKFPNIAGQALRDLLKFSKSFYKERGSPESYRFLFKMLWDDDTVNLLYPSDYILKSSDGTWANTVKMRLDISIIDDISDIVGRLIKGKKSGARAYISDYDELYDGVIDVSLENISEDFKMSETIDIFSDNTATTKLYKCRNIPVINSYTITNPGAGYLAGRNITIKNSGDGLGLTAVVENVDILTGSIKSIKITNPGKKYLYTLPTLNLSDFYLFDTTSQKRLDAEIKLNLSPMFSDTGKYLEHKSLLSDDWKLRDGDYYQEFSYVVRSNLNKNLVETHVKNLLHPAGMKMFYEKIYTENQKNYINLTNIEYTLSSELAEKSDKYIRYGNNIYYNDPIAIYM